MKPLLLTTTLLRLPYRHYGKGELPFLFILILGLLGIFVYAFVRDAFRTNSNNLSSKPLNSPPHVEKNINTIQQTPKSQQEVFEAFFKEFHTEVFYETIGFTIPQIKNSKRNFYWTTWKETWQNEKEKKAEDEIFISFDYKECFTKVFFKKDYSLPDSDKAFACSAIGLISNNKHLTKSFIEPRKWTQTLPLEKWMIKEVKLEWSFAMNDVDFCLHAKSL